MGRCKYLVRLARTNFPGLSPAVAWMAVRLLLSALLVFAQDGPTVEKSIRHVTVVNVVTGAELKDQTVRIRGNRIASIATAQPADDALPESVDARGAYLIPGLWDMHIHVHETYELPLYIANGVTGVRIMSGDKNTGALRAELARETPSPEIYLASAIVDGSPAIWPGSIVVKKPADARRAVDEIKAGGADFIKVYTRIPRDAYFALAEEARQQHIAFEGHVPDSISAQEASDAGQRSIEHLQGIALACSSRQDALMAELRRVQFFRDRLVLEAEGDRSFDGAKCQALFDEFRKHDTWQVPTLTVLRVWGRLDDSAFTSDSRMVYIGRKSRERWNARTEPQMRRWNNSQYQMARSLFAADQRVVGSMFRAGVPMMAGTDAMNPYCFPGFGLHDELALMVESGLTPLAALQAATINPAKFMGRSAELGTVEPGRIANLVLLRADPLQDIRNSTQVQSVWLGGEYFDRVKLDQLLQEAKQQAKR